MQMQQKELRRIGSTGILKKQETKNKISNALKNKEPWNKGLTKEESLEYEKEYIQAINPEYNIVHTRKNKKVGKYWK